MQVFILLFSALKKCSCLAGEPEITQEDSPKNSEQHEQETVNSDTSDICSSPESTSAKSSLTSVEEESVTSVKEELEHLTRNVYHLMRNL